MRKNFPGHLFAAQVFVCFVLITLGWPLELIALAGVALCALYLGVMVE